MPMITHKYTLDHFANHAPESHESLTLANPESGHFWLKT